MLSNGFIHCTTEGIYKNVWKITFKNIVKEVGATNNVYEDIAKYFMNIRYAPSLVLYFDTDIMYLNVIDDELSLDNIQAWRNDLFNYAKIQNVTVIAEKLRRFIPLTRKKYIEIYPDNTYKIRGFRRV